MKSVIILIVACTFIVFFSSQAFGVELTAEQSEVWELIQRGWEDIKRGAFESAMADIHDESIYIIYDELRPLYNKDQVQRFFKRWFIDHYQIEDLELKSIAVNIIDNTAIAFYFYKIRTEGAVYVHKGRVMSTFVKQNNKWKLVGCLSSSCAEPGSCLHGW